VPIIVGDEQQGDGEQGAGADILDLEIEAASWRTSCHRHRFLLGFLLERDVDDASID